MKHNQDLDELLFKKPKPKVEQSKQGEELKQLIENIPYPQADITITSYSDFSDNSGHKYIKKPVHTESIEHQPYKLKRLPTQVDPYASDGSDIKQKSKPIKQDEFCNSGGSYLESMTPQRLNRIVDWSKNHVTPGDAKNIFPQVIAPSIEFSNENSLSLNAFNKPHNNLQQNAHVSKERIEGRVWEKQKRHMDQEIQLLRKQLRKYEQENQALATKALDADEKCKYLQEKYKDYSCLENLRGKQLELAKQQNKQLKQQLDNKDHRLQEVLDRVRKLEENEKLIQDAIEHEMKELNNQIEIKDQMVRAMKNQQSNEDQQRQTALQEYEKSMLEGQKQMLKMKQQLEKQLKEMHEQAQIIQQQELQIGGLQSRLQKEAELRKQDEKIISEYRQKETYLYQQLNPQYDQHQQSNKDYEELQREYMNQKRLVMQLTEQLNNQFCVPAQSRIQEQCKECVSVIQEINALIQEGALEGEMNMEQKLGLVVRDIVLLFLEKQKESIGGRLMEQEEIIKEQIQQIKYFKNSNEEVLQDCTRLQDQLNQLEQDKEIQEQNLFNECNRLNQQNQQLQKELLAARSKNRDDGDLEAFKQQCSQLKNDYMTLEQQNNQLKGELLLYQQQMKQTEAKLSIQQSYKSCQEEKSLLNAELETIRSQFSTQLAELYQKLHQQELQIFELTKELNLKKVKLEEKERELVKLTETSAMKQKQKQKEKEIKEKAIGELQEEKSKLTQRIQQLEQQMTKETQTKQLEDKLEKLMQIGKEKDKKNIELFNANKTLSQQIKDLDTQLKGQTEENEKLKKQVQLRNQELKQTIDQNKVLQEKNQEMNQKVANFQVQIQQFEQEIKQNFQEQSPQVPEKLRTNPSARSLEPLKTPGANSKVIELVEDLNQYQQEFFHLKRMFTERMKYQESLQEKIDQLQAAKYQLGAQIQKLQNENQQLKERIMETPNGSNKRSTFDDLGVRYSAATGDSLNIKSFLHHHEQEEQHKKTVTNVFQQNMFKDMNIVDLIQPEIMSMEDTIQVLREILRRAIKSVEMMKLVCSISEIKELLVIIVQIDEKLQQQQNTSQTKRAKIISSILLNQNGKLMGSDQQRKKSGQRQKASHRSEVMDFFDS